MTHCGEHVQRTRRRIVATSLGGAALGLVLAGCTDGAIGSETGARGDTGGARGSSGSGGAGGGADGPDGAGAGTGAGAEGAGGREPDPVVPSYGILFVTQVPSSGFGIVTSTFGNHSGDVESAPRGGDLWVRYHDGTLRNLTAEAGYGVEGFQGPGAIAVREPTVHWSGRRALFAMAIGAPAEQYEGTTHRFQIHEITGLGPDETPVITRVPGQPEEYDNVAPFYGTDDRVFFASSRPRSGEAHLYPQLDEYESEPVVTGLHALDPSTGELTLVSHAPSGVFDPFVDSYGRILFTKWDHLQRDQQEEADRLGGAGFGAFDGADESPDADHLPAVDVFPEARSEDDPRGRSGESPHTFNQFFPWMIHEDGREEETLNHVGRHELGGSYTEGSFPADGNLTYATPASTHQNRVYVGDDGGFFQMAEDPGVPGRYLATNAQEFGTETAGQILAFTAGVGVNPEQIVITELTARVTRNSPESAGDPEHTGHYRSPLPLTDGRIVVSHTDEVRRNENEGTHEAPRHRYAFRLKELVDRGDGVHVAGAPLTGGIRESLSWWSPDVLVTWEGELWELDAVELRSRPRPARLTQTLPAPEQGILEEVGVDEAELRTWLAERDLALIVSRDVTSRDRADVQQPYNLRVPGGVESVAADGAVYDVTHLQLLQGDQLRGYDDHGPGRRVVARPMHEPATTPYLDDGPEGSARIAPDGSMAAFVPAGRAMTWQLVDEDASPVVRERSWVSFGAGEIRVCASCHGVNSEDQLGRPPPTNPPAALRELLLAWRAREGN